MTEHTLELAMLLPREAECGRCVEEVGRELGRLDGVHDIEADVPRGLLNVHFDEGVLDAGELRTYARRAGAQAHCADHCPLAVHAHGELDLLVPLPGEDGAQRRMLHVTGMDCADCALKLQNTLRKERGVRAADVNFGAATLAVAFDPAENDLAGVYRAVRRLGYDTVERRAEAEAARTAKAAATEGAKAAGGVAAADPASVAAAAGAATATAGISAAPAQRSFWLREPRALLTIASGAFVLGGFAAEALAPSAASWLFAAAMASGGFYVARAAFYSLRARQVDMNVLMTLAAIGAAAIGQWSEAGLVVFLFGLGTLLQVATLERTRRAITGLMSLTPSDAVTVRDGVELTVPLAEIVPGDIVLVRPGGRVAVDGVVLEGHAAADQAPVTGESRPVAKAPGDQVFAGSIIEGGRLRLRATSDAADNTIAKIVHLVEEAQSRRAPAETIVDRFAARYTPIVITLAAAVAFVPPLLGASFETWFYRGLALLIISCPCALVISTPVSILAALANATRNGVLIKGGAYLERVAGIRAIAFDKTGTLTEGRPQVTDVVALNGAAADRVLAIAAAVERLSEHPLARAIGERAKAASGESASAAAASAVATASATAAECGRGCADGSAACRDEHEHAPGDERAHVHGHAHDARAPVACACGCEDGAESASSPGPRVERFRAIPGRGVRAEVDGQLTFVGRPDLLGAHAEDPALVAAVSRLEGEGKTAVVVGDESGPLGVIAVSDPLRPGAAAAIADLRRLGVDRITMLTGDNPETAAAIAAQAGIGDVRAGLLPADKVAAVVGLGGDHDAVAMVGDGVNDAPALAAAGLGIAMGAAGTDAALETADIALMGDDLGAVPETIRLARRTTHVIWQNIAFSIVVKAIFLILAPLGLVTLWLAVFADMGTSLLVTANGLRLYRR
ncbi:MAG TPA: heavy metal translocating P-type ATPase [Thermoleophilia bacterium]|nr:heavy metal translocating P-type ATPase [Thermoleophilia bacterium]